MENLKIKNLIIGALIILVIIAAVIFLSIYWRHYQKSSKNFQVQSLMQVELEAQPKVYKPAKTDFGNKIPPDFIQEIPIEKKAKIEQSYSFDYSGQKQLTIVFESEKTIEQNRKIYSDFLANNQWSVVNNYFDKKIASLYGLKENKEINVTISFDELAKKTNVSISILEKQI